MTYRASRFDGPKPATGTQRPALRTRNRSVHVARNDPARSGSDLWARVGSACDRLSGHMPLPRVIAQSGDIGAAAIAHTLFNIDRKKLFLNDARVPDILDQLMGDAAEIPNRHHLLRALRQRGQIASDRPDRDFKPAGTVPCARTLGQVVEVEYGRPMTEIASPSRRREIAEARFHAIWLMRHICGYSLNVIGGHFGGRDHTTILNAVKKIEDERTTQPALADRLERLCEEIDDLSVSQSYGRIQAAAAQDLRQ
jgi:hypothetical protein